MNETIINKSTKTADTKAMERQLFKLKELEVRAKYPHQHIIEGSLRRQPSGKLAVTIRCSYVDEDGDQCENERELATSDLFQVDCCHAHAKLQKKARSKGNKTAAKLRQLLNRATANLQAAGLTAEQLEAVKAALGETTGRAEEQKAEESKADAGQADAGQVDAGQADAGQVDAGQVDAGQVDAEPKAEEPKAE